MVNSLLSKWLLATIRVYQKFISPVLPARCRYYPTCSQYGITAISWHGPRKGLLLTLKRLSRCHPLGGHGIDFVPLPLSDAIFKPLSTAVLSVSTDLSIINNSMSTNITSKYDKENCVSRETVIVERGVYRDVSSYTARLNAYLTHR